MFILPYIYAEHMIPIENEVINFGIINFNGYRSHIFSTGLDEKVINLPIYKLSPGLCTTDDYILAIKPGNDINYLIGKTKKRQLNLFEWGNSLFSNISFNNINIHSEDETGNNQLIHHSLFVKYTAGYISTGAGLIMSFSPIYKRGYKSLLYCRLNNKLFGVLILYKSNEDYMTPFYKNQPDGWRTKNTFSLKPISWLSCEYGFNYHDSIKVIKRENNLKIDLLILFNTLTFKSVVKEREEKSAKRSHYIESITVKSEIFNLLNTLNFELHYINAPFYKGYNSISFKLLKDSLVFNLKYSWKYVVKADHFFSSSVKLNRKDWSLSFKYESPLVRDSDKWSLSGTLKQKF